MADTGRFDQAAASWDALPRRVRMAQEIAAAVALQVPLSNDLDVLDFGCGTGLVALFLQPLVGRVTGADASPGMLDAFRQKLTEQGLTNVETVLVDSGALLALPKRFHLIVSSMALHHVADLAPLFRAFHEHLHPGGRVALADLDREDGTFHEDPHGVYHLDFERSEIVELLTAAGFVEVHTTTATVTSKEGREYPIFLATGRKGA